MSKETVKGNTAGLRKGILEELQSLYEMKTGRDCYLPADLAEKMALLTCAINREISVILTASGEVTRVSVGTLSDAPVETEHIRRASAAHLRCVHTHPGGNPHLSEADLSLPDWTELESVCAVGVSEDGGVTGVCAAFLPDMEEECVPLSMIPQEKWMRKLLAVRREETVTEEDTRERALLVGTDSLESLEELKALAETAGALTVDMMLQKGGQADSNTWIGSGKVQEVRMAAQVGKADLVIFDDELSGKQLRNLEDMIGVRVIDRTALILDIFAGRAVTNEGKLQVMAAQLHYRANRLIGTGTELSRLGGGIGTRGPGETKLEMDRRRIRDEITAISRKLETLSRERDLRRQTRIRNAVPAVALVGYTNTGKSTLLNRIAGADVYTENQLFATLDSVSRKVETEQGEQFILTDTVGFINKLPHDLVEAFRSTLEEAALADILIIVSDASDPHMEAHRKTVGQVLGELGADWQPRIEVLNKCDLPRACTASDFNAIRISAKRGDGIGELMDAISRCLREREGTYTASIPYSDYAQIGVLEEYGRILKRENGNDGVSVTFRATEKNAGLLTRKYRISVRPVRKEV